jgi:type I restriction enzyme R subunit
MEQVKKNQSAKARASEMEHAIRKHCKVNWEKDPALYKKMSEKLDDLIHKHQEDWDKLAAQLELLTEEVVEGRGEKSDDTIEAPFRDLIADMAFNGNPMSDEEVAVLKTLTHKLLEKIRDSINIVDFWENAFEVKRLKGELSDILLASNIEAIIDQCDHIVSEITALAKVRHNDLV